PDDARRERQGARPRARVPPRAGASAGHVSAHAARRDRGAVHPGGLGPAPSPTRRARQSRSAFTRIRAIERSGSEGSPAVVHNTAAASVAPKDSVIATQVQVVLS